MEDKFVEDYTMENKSDIEIKNSKLYYIIPLLNIIFPIISIEGLVPWTIAIYFCYIGMKEIKKSNKPLKRCLLYLLISGCSIAIYNVLVYYVSNYLVKLLM